MKEGINLLTLILLIGFGISNTACAKPVASRSEAVDLVSAELFPEGNDDVVIYVWGLVPPQTTVNSLCETVLTTPESGYIIYIDDEPVANFFHPVHYCFVSGSDGKIEITKAGGPPANYQDYDYVKTAIGEKLIYGPNRRPDYKGTPPPIDQGCCWAILMNGGLNAWANYPRYWNDLSNIYVALNQVYGFADERIIALSSDGIDPAPDQSNSESSPPDLDGDGDDDIGFACTRTALEFIFDSLATVVTEEDLVFIFATDHGSTQGGWNTSFNLWTEDEITDAEFTELVQLLPANNVICTLEPCYSGGFLDNLAVEPGQIIVTSACTHDEPSYAMPPDYAYDTYVFHWTAAIAGFDAYGEPVNADFNSDGQVTMDEAFNYAATHDQSNETPQFAEMPAGWGAITSLWPVGLLPGISIDIQPLIIPVTIPAEGGNFQYTVTIENSDTESAEFNCWIDVTFPYGGISDPVTGPIAITMPPESSITRLRSQYVPSYVSAGLYSYNAYVGITPERIYDISSFQFTKSSGSNIAYDKHDDIEGWITKGDSFKIINNTKQEASGFAEKLKLTASPNPFNPVTTLSYRLEKAEKVKLCIYNTSGQLIESLADGYQPAGGYLFNWDGSSFSSGLYFYHLQTNHEQAAGKLLLLK